MSGGSPPAPPLRPFEGGIELAVRVRPGARRQGPLGLREGRLEIALRAPAREGRANEALREVLAELLEVPRSAVVLVAGERSREKRVRVAGDPERLARRLAAAIGEGAAGAGRPAEGGAARDGRSGFDPRSGRP